MTLTPRFVPRDFRLLLVGAALSNIGTQVQMVAIGWELYQRTNSATALGLVGLIQFLPVLFLSLPAGHAADRHSRKLLLVGAQGAKAAAALGLSFLSFWEGPIPLMYLCLLVAGCGQAFNNPVRWSLIPQLVPEQTLASAVTWSSSSMQLASVLGPALGGVVLGLAEGEATGAYLLAILCFLVCGVLVFLLRPRPGPPRLEEVTLRSLLAGIRFVWQTQPILATITLDLFAVLLGGATALLPIFARDIVDVGPAGLGWLEAAPALGAVLMALVLAHRPPLRRPGRDLLWAVAGFGLATIGFGLSRNFFLSFVLLALTGALDNISVVVRQTLVQVLTPDAMRGRVSAVNAIFIGSSNQLGDFESGITAAWFGPVGSVVVGGAGTIAVVIAVFVAWPSLLRLEALHLVGRPPHPAEEGGLAGEEQMALPGSADRRISEPTPGPPATPAK